MSLTDVSVAPDMVSFGWSDGTQAHIPSIWLRDNCPSGFHPQTGERVFDLLSVPETPLIRSGGLRDGAVWLSWQDGHESRFDPDWITAHVPGTIAADAGQIAPTLWVKGMTGAQVPRHKAADVMADDTALLAWMQDTARMGVSIIEGLEDDIEAGVAVAERVGFLRRTNFGTVFEVVSKPDPNNLAYTSVALPLHTDLPNQEVPPGYQFLHCLANEAEGGGSVLADGFAMAEDIRLNDPEAFELLSTVAIPFRFHDGETDLRIHSPVIVLDRFAAVQEIRYNAHLADVFDMAPDQLAAYYRAYRAYMARTRDPAFQVTLRLKGGEMLVFDNRRALHGRESFDPTTGYRHLHGCYVDRGEFLSRLRVMARG